IAYIHPSIIFKNLAMNKTNHLILVFVSACITCASCKKEPVTSSAVSGSRTDNNTSVNANAICDYDLNETTLTSAGWTKVFEDNFSGDLSKWNTWTGGAFNNELQYYQGANLQVQNGTLLITAKKETVTGATTPFDATPKTFNYTSGRIECKTNISASSATPKVRVIGRLKLPPGYGMWPAFWSYGDPWPQQGEIDYMEARGQEPTKYQTNYFYGRAANRNLVKNQVGFITANLDLQSCWHVYEMIWTQNSLTFMLDGQVVITNTGSYVPNLFGKTERVTLNLAVGGNFFTNFNPALIQTGTYAIDWIKVFTSN
ncbi:MAG TPA: glycoside hydrolase family 16 protein, partial [Parafilimonas sp.]|nr:glycoside hydrolase family 16 protein [Parafilimonas sp.]